MKTKIKTRLKSEYELLIVGGGLSGALLAYRLEQLQPGRNWLLLEQGESLGGNHSWAFHHTDVSSLEYAWLEELVDRSWPLQEVCFPAFKRQIPVAYHAIRSESFSKKVMKRCGEKILLRTRVKNINWARGELEVESPENGEEILRSACIIDATATGTTKANTASPLAYQKFLGWDLELEHPHQKVSPLIMDSSCSIICKQDDDFRFFYVLPWSTHSLLIEETRYSLQKELDLHTSKEAIAAYAKAQNWHIKKWTRSETAALPIPLNPKLFCTSTLPQIGLAAGFFHPVTGYSLPFAVKTAEHIAQLQHFSEHNVLNTLKELKVDFFHHFKFFGFLNRLLFLAAYPNERLKVMQGFYKLPWPLIARFYANRLSLKDQIRFFIRKPPISLSRALQSIFDPKVFYVRKTK